MKILGVTLARGGSKGVPDKNIKMLNGIPLIGHTFKIIPDIKHLDRYIVSTDCPKIQEYCLSQNIDCPFLRPEVLSTDTATSSAALRHAVQFCEDQEKIKYDYIVELMCTNPFKNSSHVNKAVELMLSANSDSVIGVSQVEEYHPARLKKIVDGKIVDFCVPELSSRRQDLVPKAYIRNGSIYVICRDKLIHNDYRFGGTNSLPIVMEDPCNVNIDSIYDFALAETIMTSHL